LHETIAPIAFPSVMVYSYLESLKIYKA